MPKTHVCGCVTEIHPRWGVQHSTFKCPAHTQEKAMMTHGLAHHIEMGAIIDGIPQHQKYILELLDPLREMRAIIPTGNGELALEIGCGLGMYAPLFIKHGYDYRGIEPDHEAAKWTEMTFNVGVSRISFEEYSYNTGVFAVLMAAHVFEHLKDAPGAIAKVYDMLKPGGVLYLIVPDDSDPLNPDHIWFFNVDSLRLVMETVGFEGVQMTMRKRIERENFIYAIGVK